MFSKSLLKSRVAVDASPASVHEIAAGPAWEGSLQAAMGDDTALLALAMEAASIEHKLSAVLALAGEDALRTAEREFRKHDRRVHSLAKQRYETLVKQRETRAAAAELIQAAGALIEAPMIPANRLVELNQAWEVLDAELLADGQKSEFSELQSRLAELMRGRAERKRSSSRWLTAAKQALTELNVAGTRVVAGDSAVQELARMFATASEAARAALAEMPAAPSAELSEDGSIAALAAAMRSALQEAALIETRLGMLAELPEGQAPRNAALDEAARSWPAALTLGAISERWRGLPPIADQPIENALNARFETWLRLQREARQKLQAENRLRVSEKDKATMQARLQAFTQIADAAAAALAAGHLAEAGKHLTSLQTTFGKGGNNAAMQARIGVLQAEFARLKGWQHWGGGRVRDDLVLEAEALAASTIVAEGSRPPKLPLKQLEKSIEQLRVRWKELDRLGGATSRPLWQRFEGALKTAYLPVAAQLSRLNEARQENLSARKSLLDALDGFSVGADEQGPAPDWKEIGRALSHFQTEWRKLGPIEHTVPHKAQAGLLARMKASVERLEVPLQEAQVDAQSRRQELIVRAQALSQVAQSRELFARLRELQSEWQSHARSQPLLRKVENQLWAEFKAATDAAMSQREAIFSARDAEFKANQATREALIARLAEIHEDTPPAEIKRALAAADAEWRKAGEAPRNQAAKLESRYRAAREKAQEHVAGSAQRSWNRSCDVLLAKLELCAELERADPALPATADDIGARWADLPPLPPRWEQALQARYRSGGGMPVPGTNGPLDQLLLQLESSFDIPSPAAFQLARRTLKLLAMKDAMEGRKSAAPAATDVEGMLATLFGYSHLDADQHSRLAAIIAALRRSGPGR